MVSKPKEPLLYVANCPSQERWKIGHTLDPDERFQRLERERQAKVSFATLTRHHLMLFSLDDRWPKVVEFEKFIKTVCAPWKTHERTREWFKYDLEALVIFDFLRDLLQFWHTVELDWENDEAGKEYWMAFMDGWLYSHWKSCVAVNPAFEKLRLEPLSWCKSAMTRVMLDIIKSRTRPHQKKFEFLN